MAADPVIRTYTLPFGVVPVCPRDLAGCVLLGDPDPDGLVRSFKVNRVNVGEPNPEWFRVVRVEVSVSFQKETQVRISLGYHKGFPEGGVWAGTLHGGWSVQRGCVLDPPQTQVEAL